MVEIIQNQFAICCLSEFEPDITQRDSQLVISDNTKGAISSVRTNTTVSDYRMHALEARDLVS